MDKIEISDSESEFWQDLDKQVSIISAKPVKSEIEKTETLENEAKKFMETVPVAYYRETMEKLLSQLRVASQVQLESKLYFATKDLTKKHSETVSTLKKFYTDEVKSLKLEFIQLEKKLKEKDSRISALEKFIIEQEQSVSFLRVDKKNKYSEEARVKELESEMYANKMSFNIQMNHMKQVVELYKKDTDSAIAALKEMEKNYNDKIEEFEQYRKDKSEELMETRKIHEAQIKSVNEKYENFKLDVEKELNVRFVINKRQNEFIEVLKRELRNAKTIIETPRLNAKYLKRIGKRGFSLADGLEVVDNEKVQMKLPSKIMNKKNSVISSSFSTSASPIYSNASEIDLSNSHKNVRGLESKYH